MNKHPLSNLIALGEGFTAEFKRTVTSNLGWEICAFDNATGGFILIGVDDDREIVTPGSLPAGMREEDLGVKSVPRNPLLFGMFYRMEMVEQVGSGIKRIREMCRDYGVAEPVIEVSENWVTTTFKRPIEQLGEQVADEVTGEVWPQPESRPELQPESLERRVLGLLSNGPMAKSVLSTGLGQKEVSGQLNKIIRLLLANKIIEYTIPEKPNSRLQEYRLTKKGKEFLEKSRGIK